VVNDGTDPDTLGGHVEDSRLPDWLTALGYEVPGETVINSFQGYASRLYRSPAEFAPDWKGLYIQQAPPDDPRGGIVVPVEGGRWLVSLLGGDGDYPPTDEAGFLAFARSLRSPALYEAIAAAEPLTPISGHRATENLEKAPSASREGNEQESSPAIRRCRTGRGHRHRVRARPGPGQGRPAGPAWEVDADEWWRTIEVNLRSTLVCSRLVLPDMVARRRGRIINITSEAGVPCWPWVWGYAVSKAAAVKFTENLTFEPTIVARLDSRGNQAVRRTTIVIDISVHNS
jgi:short chain dehydrogenase